MPTRHVSARKKKYGEICEWVVECINRGQYLPGQRLPGELQLVRHFGVSRPTVARALLELEKTGLIERRAGSGTYVQKAKNGQRYVFGLLIPDLGQTEIFEPICQGIAESRQTMPFDLVWGQTQRGHSAAEKAQALCEQFISTGVSGVFLAPLELTDGKDLLNQRIAQALENAHIPVVLLDRDICPYPQRSRYDLVGIDNSRAGYLVTEHALKLGCRRIVFLGRPNSAPTVEARARGFRDALSSCDISATADWVIEGNPDDAAFVQGILESMRPEAFVCANDVTAATLMRTLGELGLQIPTDVRIVGIDDVRYASLLHVPLTTLHQPCRDLGAAATMTMFARIAHPDMPALHVMLDCKLVIRKSCGSDPCLAK
jgi:DNA-binding LacI/PurR family transcriptional regulator